MKNPLPYNPLVRVTSPFPEMELPVLFCWYDAQRDTAADDVVPETVTNFVHWVDDRQRGGVHTFAAYKERVLFGYVEAAIKIEEPGELSDTATCVAQVRSIFKREFWDWRYTRTALNLALKDIFERGVETVYLPAFKHAKGIQGMYHGIGARDIGRVAP